ncbi:MAG: T9SS type A sorting domain-containing protein, partial [Saprospiraceae bacterium]|nr:T9SS type A sorting domain-containing protein [Saprospiraceae bacterium]
TGQVAIYNLAGRQIRTHKIAAIDRVQIDVHDLNTGMYFLKFTTVGGKVYVSKFIKS